MKQIPRRRDSAWRGRSVMRLLDRAPAPWLDAMLGAHLEKRCGRGCPFFHPLPD